MAQNLNYLSLVGQLVQPQPTSSNNRDMLLTPSPPPPAPAGMNRSLLLPKLLTRDASDESIYESSASPASLGPPTMSHPYGASSSPPNKFSRSRAGTTNSVFSDGSPGKRVLSDKVKSTPSSLVRQLRIYSNSSNILDGSNSSIRSPTPVEYNNLAHQNRLISQSLPPELSPVVSLLNAQKLRTYALGNLKVPGVIDSGEKVWFEVEAKLTGNELAIWRPSDDPYLVDGGNDEYKPKYINVTDCKIELLGDAQYGYEVRFLQDFTGHSTAVRFLDNADLIKWYSAIQLAKFEYTSLNEAFSAVMLSLKGPSLSDIHILLSPKKRFPKHEWCNLRLPQISSKWLKVHMVILPGDGKKTGRIEMYTSEKLSKKTMLLYIPMISSVYNVYPEHHSMIDINSIMKLNGEIYVNKNHEHLFVHQETDGQMSSSPSRSRSLTFKSHSRAGSSSSLTSFGSPEMKTSHSRNVSTNSTSSFFNNAPSPNPESLLSSSPVDSSPKKSKSTKSHHSSFFKSKQSSNYVSTSYLYLMPIAHPGVPAIEIMLRNFIHIIDAFKLYGRPSHLNSDKTDPQSLLFSLPSLPHYEYLSLSDATRVVNRYIDEAKYDNWNEFKWRNAIKTFIREKISSSNYKGAGNIIKLYNDLDIDTVEINDYETISSPKITLPANAESPTSTNFDLGNFSPLSASRSGSDEKFNPSTMGGGEKFTHSALGDPIEFEETIPKSFAVDPNEHPYQTLVGLSLEEKVKN